MIKQPNARRRIADYLRNRIISGELAPDDQIPTAAQLAKQFDTCVSNAYKAMTVLMREGLINTCQKSGSTVSQTGRELKKIAICYVNDDLKLISRFRHNLMHHCEKELAAQNIESVILFEKSYERIIQIINQMNRSGEIQGAIFVLINLTGIAETKKLEVPCSTIGSARVPYGVDHKEVHPLIFKEIKYHKVQRVGMLNQVAYETMDIEPTSPHLQNIEDFKKLAALSGLELRDEWIFRPEKVQFEHKRFAYETIRKIAAMEKEQRPQILYVPNEEFNDGVMLALLNTGLKVPEDLRLIIFSTEEDVLLKPVDYSYIECSANTMARALVSQVVDQFYGKKVRKIRTDIKLKRCKAD